MTFESEGYTDLRNYLQNNWNHIAVLDDTGTEQIRLEVGTDSNATFISDSSTNPLTAELVVSGQNIQDAGGSLPVTLNKTEAYKSSSATTVMGSDTMSDATLEQSGDEVTITHDYEMPQI